MQLYFIHDYWVFSTFSEHYIAFKIDCIIPVSAAFESFNAKQ